MSIPPVPEGHCQAVLVNKRRSTLHMRHIHPTAAVLLFSGHGGGDRGPGVPHIPASPSRAPRPRSARFGIPPGL